MDLPKKYRLAAIIEGTRVTGPLKNVLQFCQDATTPPASFDFGLDAGIVTFFRGEEGGSNDFLAEVQKRNLRLSVVYEKKAFEPGIISELKKKVLEQKPDIIQTHGVKSHLVTSISGLRKLVPWIAIHHGYTYTDWKMEAYNHLDRFSLPRANHVITVCEYFKNDLVTRRGVKPEKVSVVMNAISPTYTKNVTDESIRYFREKLRVSSEQRLVVAIGRLSREKGYLELVRAWGRVASKLTSPATLVFLGEGPDLQLLKDEAQALGVRESIVFGGHWTTHIAEAFSTSSLMVLPSHTEGSPNVLLEAMITKTPVIATRVGGVPEMVTHGKEAFLVPAKSPESLGDALLHALNNPELLSELSEAGYQRATSEFSPEERRRKLFAVYAHVLKENGRA